MAFDDVCKQVDDISIGGFGVSDISTERQIGERIKVGLAIPFRDFECTVVATAEVVHVDRDKRALGCTFVDLTESQTKLIRQIVRAFLTGAYVTVDDFLVSQTELTTTRSALPSEGADVASRARHVIWRVVRYGILAMAGLLLLGLVGLSFYFAFFTLEADVAAVSGRAVTLTAPVDGRISAVGARKGRLVERGDVLFRLYDPVLVSDLTRAREDLAVAEARLADADDFPQSRPGRREAEAAVEAASAYADALFNQDLQMAVRSPCSCLVTSVSASDDLWVRRGHPLIELTDPDDIMVEALVPSDRANKLRVGARANIALADRPDALSGWIVSVDHVPAPVPRAGLPAAVRGRDDVASVLIVPDNPLRGVNVGLPAQVSFPLNWRSALFPLSSLLE